MGKRFGCGVESQLFQLLSAGPLAVARLPSRFSSRGECSRYSAPRGVGFIETVPVKCPRTHGISAGLSVEFSHASPWSAVPVCSFIEQLKARYVSSWTLVAAGDTGAFSRVSI